MAPRRISTIRREGSFRRRSKGKPPRSVTLIVCEGETERVYFEVLRLHLKLTNAEVLIPADPTGTSPRQLVDFAAKRSKEGGTYDRIFCVFDRDDHGSFSEARARIRELATNTRTPVLIGEAVSVPCWEIWVLLHFQQTDAPFGDCAAVIRRIRERHLAHYAKADRRVTAELITNHARAVVHAEWLETRTGRVNDNPSTSVHHLVKHLLQVALMMDGR